MGNEKPKEEEKPVSELDDDELLRKLFPKKVRKLVKGQDPDSEDDDDESDDDDEEPEDD